MAKTTIKEISELLGADSKDVIAFLNENGFEAKSPRKGLEDEQIELVTKKFKKEVAKPAEEKKKPDVKEVPAAEKEVKAEPKAEAKPKDRPAEAKGDDKPKKKKNITVFVNRGNMNGKNPNGRRRDDRNPHAQGNRPGGGSDNRGGREGAFSPIRPRPMSERTVRPQATRVRPEEEKITVSEAPSQNNVTRTEHKRPEGNQNRGKENARPQERDFNKNRPKKGPEPQQNASENNAKAQDPRRGDKGQKNNNKKKTQEHDALGSKKQERFVNLEKNGGKKKQKYKKDTPTRNEDEILTITLPERITIKELAEKMIVAPSEIVKKLFMKGQMVTVNQNVDYEQAEEIALEFNCVCEPEEKVDVIAELLKEDEENEKDMITRPPVVCVMGHVDHGKTSLLDAIRDTRVTDREAGGITQKIGAYGVSINGQKITFLDTPGHEAFTAMRMRGASSTDIAILVVAADDGVMPQTVEAINHAKAAGIEIIVAINKIDKPNANIERVKQELSEYELIPSDWGGSTEFVPVSAHTHEGIDDLLETILLTAEILELKANPKRNARGLCIEAELDKGRGVVATVLVQKGTLHVGDPIAAGSAYGKVRAMIDEYGRNVKKAGPSTAVEILGLSEVPNAGEIFVAMDNEKEARSFAETFISENKNKLIEETRSRMSLDDLFSQIQAGNLKELDLIVKADVQGSVEAVKQSLEKLSNEEVVVKVIHGGVGAINESDVILASASNAIIIGFNVRPDPSARQTAEHEGVDIRLYKVIYNAIEDVEAAMKGMLEPIYEEKVIGHAEIRQIFKASGVGNIAGSYILDGSFQRDCSVRITRADEQIFEGKLASLKRFKDDVKEVKAGYECGLVFDGFDAIAEEDKVEAYIMVEVPRS
ncbi:MAG: translation initiation factor IF-2 [Lachnospiraceae bacterium]|nr:translation initiation factor IF-2 [Lachnospiraceae bacterium]